MLLLEDCLQHLLGLFFRWIDYLNLFLLIIIVLIQNVSLLYYHLSVLRFLLFCPFGISLELTHCLFQVFHLLLQGLSSLCGLAEVCIGLLLLLLKLKQLFPQ